MQVVEGRDHSGEAGREPTRPAARSGRGARSRLVLRLAFAAAFAAACCWEIWQHVPTRLAIRTNIVGYPTFYNFDYVRYFTAFSLIAILLPTLVFAADHVLGARGPLRRPLAQGSLLPLRWRSEEPVRQRPGRLGAPLSSLGRLALVATTVVVEVSAASSPASRAITSGGVYAGMGELAVVAALGLGLAAARGEIGRWRPPRAPRGEGGLASSLSRANALVAPIVLLLLWPVSQATNVTVSGHGVVHYPWFPGWLAVLGTLVAEAVVIWRLKTVPARRIEGQLLAVLVGTLLVFLLVGGIPSAQGPFDSFDPQELAGAQLVLVHGMLPWRNVILLHGFLEDAFDGWLGMAVFTHTAWGAFAGIDLFVYPASACLFYLFSVYFARGNRFVPLIAGLLIVGGYTTAIMRFAFLPLAVVLFDYMLRRRSWASAASFMFVLVLECAFAPEVLLMAAALLVTLVLRELVGAPGQGGRFFLTRACFVSGLLFSGAFFVYLAASGSVSGFAEYFILFTPDHALWGALPTAWSLSGQPRITVFFWLPVALVLVVAARTIAQVRLRRPLSSRDWVMIACAGFVLVYDQKGLDRTDVSHVIEVYTVATPLVILSAITALEWCEGRFARLVQLVGERRRGRHGGDRRPALRAPVALAAAVVIAAAVPTIGTRLQDAPGATHASAPGMPTVPRLGYQIPADFPSAEVQTLGHLLDVYAGTSGPVFDFANEPVVTYFLLNRTPGSAFFHVEMAETLPAQKLLIRELERSRPRVVIFTAQDLGLGLAYDGIPGMVRNWLVSQYLLTHYTPLANAYGQLLFLRSDLVGTVPSVASLHLPGVSTSGLYFAGQSCLWGDTPNFFPAPQIAPGSRRAARVSGGQLANYQLSGWAVDAHVLTPAREVFAVSGGRVIGTARPSIYRLDIEDYFHSAAVVDSGWSMDVEIPHGQRAQLYSINRDGTVSRLQPNPAPSWLASSPKITSVIGPGGRRYQITRGHWLPGWTNYATPISARVYHLVFPPGTRLAADQWLTLHSSSSLGGARYVLGDQPAVTGRQVSFNALRTAGRSLSVRVGSCLDWHGFGRRLELVVDRAGGGPPVALSASVAEARPGT